MNLKPSIGGSAAEFSEKFGFGARLWSKVQEKRWTNRDRGNLRGGPLISVMLINKQWTHIRELCTVQGLSLTCHGFTQVSQHRAVKQSLATRTVTRNNTIVFIVMSSIAERSTTGLKLPVLRIPQGQAKQISHT